ncbi:phosphatase PAP2 family protein [Methylobacterium fujisawaense]
MLVLPSDFHQMRARLWLLILAMAVLAAAWMRAAGLALDAASTLTPALSCAGLELLATFYSTRRLEPRFAVSLSSLAQVIAFSACAALLSYAVAATGGPLWDGTFRAIDQSLGLDWLAYLHSFNDHPWIGFALSLAYQSLMTQLIVVVIVLGLGGHLRAVPEFVLAFMLAGLTTIV